MGTGSGKQLHGHVRILLHLTQFCICRHHGLMCLSLCGHITRLPRKRRKMMSVFVATCVATIRVTYQSVVVAT